MTQKQFDYIRTEAYLYSELKTLKKIMDIIESKENALDDEDVSGHIWWNKFKEEIQAIIPAGERLFNMDGRHESHALVRCSTCGSVVAVKNTFHTYQPDGQGDVEPVDFCYTCFYQGHHSEL